MRRLDWLMMIALVVVALAGKLIDFDGPRSDPDSPRRPSPEAFTPKFWDAETRAWMTQFPGKTGSENPTFARLPSSGVIEESTVNSSSTGSAFSISRNGLWLTARHVVWGCDKTYIQTGDKKALRVDKVTFHPQADVALLATSGAPEPLALSKGAGVKRDAFGVGFPKGQPGAVHGAFIGEMTMHHRGRNGYRERVDAWSERSRIPGRKGSLGGLSGGAVLDDQGQIIGIIQAESPRRGRFMTARLETIQTFLQEHTGALPNSATPNSEFAMTSQFYPQTARQLLTTLRVAKVLCFVG